VSCTKLSTAHGTTTKVMVPLRTLLFKGFSFPVMRIPPVSLASPAKMNQSAFIAPTNAHNTACFNHTVRNKWNSPGRSKCAVFGQMTTTLTLYCSNPPGHAYLSKNSSIGKGLE